MPKLIFKSFGISVVIAASLLAINFLVKRPEDASGISLPVINLESPNKKVDLGNIPVTKVLDNGGYHIFQTFNNCGPAALSMALSYYGINSTQAEIGQKLRPYQNPEGDNDDKSVTLEELAKESENYGLIPYHRPNGNINLIKQFVAQDMPVITRTWTKANEDIGHFRIVKGYDESSFSLLQDDSLQGKNLWYTYADFEVIWKKFNYEYLVLVPREKIDIAEAILGEDVNPDTSWKKAVDASITQLKQNPDDIHARFNLSVAYFHIGNYQASVEEFEKVENKLPFRTLWYQIEPLIAYYELGDYQRVLSLTDKILNGGNRAFSELYILRGNVFLKSDQETLAKQEFEKAVFYNRNLKEAQ